MKRIRIGAVSYLNTWPLVCGLDRNERVDLSFAVPAKLAEQMAARELDMALLPVIELARSTEDLEVVPGLAIGTRGPSRSVLLISRVAPDRIRRLALDPESRTSNILARVLLSKIWESRPETEPGMADLNETLKRCDAAVRIGDKALFETVPPDMHVMDLGEVWTEATSLPFVFAVWAARPGVVDRELYVALHDARRRGTQRIETFAQDFRWSGRKEPERVREYLTRHIRYRLGTAEFRAMRAFLGEARAGGWTDRVPPIRFALQRKTTCNEIAEERGISPRSVG